MAVEEILDCDSPVKKIHLRIPSAEEHTPGIGSVAVKERTSLQDTLFQLRIFLRVISRRDGEADVKFWSRGFTVLLPHLVARVVNSKRNSRKYLCYMFRGTPVFGVFGVSIIDIKDDAVGAYEFIVAALVIFILSSDVIM